ncbi:uncharacterized protein [Palaemon carinicauda]|uniref:uncharacterized protein isoform X1 n=1 Tax=Palaemon carinicauda TaxID=392227 RepID=UPI0035B5E914
MSFNAGKFFEDPRGHLLSLRDAKKNDLRKIAEQAGIPVLPSMVKAELLGRVLDFLVAKASVSSEETAPLRPLTLGRGEAKAIEDPELVKLKLQLELEREKKATHQAEYEQKERMIALERREREEKIQMERQLASIRLNEKGKERELGECFSLTKALKLLPPFDEKEPDVFFGIFEDTATTLHWPKEQFVLLIRSALKGKAAHIASQMLEERDYYVLKKAVLDAYTITAEGYRQMFRNSIKGTTQTYLELFQVKLKQFRKWLESENITTFEQLQNLMVLEEFLRRIPSNISMYIRERQEKEGKKAALLADEYHLIHKVKKHNSTDQASINIYCSFCKQKGHAIKDCPNPRCQFSKVMQPSQQTAGNRPETTQSKNQRRIALHCSQVTNDFSDFLCSGTVNNYPVKLLRDTGSSQTIVSGKLKPLTQPTNKYVTITDLCSKLVLPLVNMHIDCPYFTGRTEVALLDRELPCEKADILLGNDLAEGTVLPNLIISQPGCVIENEQNQQEVLPCQATTRSAATKAAIGVPTDDDTLNSLPDLVGLHHDEFVNLQRSDDSLKGCFNKVENPSDKSHKLPLFYLENNILMRHYRSPTLTEKDSWRDCHQLVVPGSLRSSIMKLAHSAESHLGITKTYRRLLEDFYWPRMKMDVKSFVERCHVCQVTGRPNEKIPPAPLVPIVVPSTPFDKIIIDCVGPLPKTSRRNEYILSVLCPTTRFPLAFPLKNISARNIIQQLIKVFTLFGFPRELQCDRGTNFTSTLFQSALHQFNIFNVLSSAYHPQSNGALERVHQTLKNLLRRYGMETEKEWDEDIDLLLYILRSVPNESTGVSPFEMMFGRRPRSNLSMIKEQILKGSRKENQISLPQYLKSLEEKLLHIHAFARKNLQHAQELMKDRYDKKAKVREFKCGDKVLVYHCVPGSPLREKFMGPYKIIRRTTKTNYVIATPDRRKPTQLVHVNLIKPYHESTTGIVNHVIHDFKSAKQSLSLTPLNHRSQNEMQNEMQTPTKVGTDVSHEDDETDFSVKSTLSWKDMNNSEILKSLPRFLDCSTNQKKDLSILISKYASICSDRPGSCTKVKHDLVLEPNTNPIRQSFYRVSHRHLPILKQEVEYLLEHNLAKPSTSPWASPCILVRKANNTYRLCTDYRKLNLKTVKDSYPLPRITDIIDSVSNTKYLTQIDLLKGYYQIKLTERAKKASAFITPFGLFEYNVLPFGLTNAPATFQRTMQDIIRGLPHVHVYLDDIVVATTTWEEHLRILTSLFERLREANLTINLAKSSFGKGQVDASNIGFGGVLLQEIASDGAVSLPLLERLLPIAYHSGFFKGSQLRWATVEKELFSIINTVLHFRPYLEGLDNVVVYSDHMPLSFLHRAKFTNQKLLRWSYILSSLNIEVRKISGSRNTIADALSRQPRLQRS